jgi:hypothetical protein
LTTPDRLGDCFPELKIDVERGEFIGFWSKVLQEIQEAQLVGVLANFFHKIAIAFS